MHPPCRHASTGVRRFHEDDHQEARKLARTHSATSYQLINGGPYIYS